MILVAILVASPTRVFANVSPKPKDPLQACQSDLYLCLAPRRCLAFRSPEDAQCGQIFFEQPLKCSNFRVQEVASPVCGMKVQEKTRKEEFGGISCE